MFYVPWNEVLCSQINRYKSGIVKDKSNGPLIGVISAKI
tara:strand:+ start:65 stop:181 length:117 start_codon:yes stop_codon:yes gene_type:complete